jgi:hypothetical protein
LYWVGRSDLNRLPARVRRLFACACVRRVWHLLTDERSRRGVEVAERFADGEASREELDAAALLARAAANQAWGPAARAAAWIAADEALDAVEQVARAVAEEVVGPRPDCGKIPARFLRLSQRRRFAEELLAWEENVRDAADRQEHLLWDLMEDVLPPRPDVSPEWLTPTVIGVARRIYSAHDFAVLPVLPDALEDAGCGDARLLAHLHGGGEHIRGCWALDAVLELRCVS